MKNNVYTGSFDDVNWYQVWLNGEHFDPRPSQRLHNHSPDGFAFGYQGSGPAQLALGILLEETGDDEIALQNYQDFKSHVIAGLSDGGWRLTSAQVRDWLAANIDS